MKDISTSDLRLIFVVCELRSLSRAAEQLNITSSAVSKRVAQLEWALGEPILVRGRHGAQPTPAGRILLEHARAILFAMDRISDEIALIRGGADQKIKILAAPTVIAQSLLDEVSEFMKLKNDPTIQIEIDEKRGWGVSESLRQGSSAIGVCWDQIDLHDLEQYPYKNDRLALAVPSENPIAKKKSIEFVESLDFHHIVVYPDSAVNLLLQRIAKNAAKPLKLRGVVSSFDAALRMVGTRMGVAVVPNKLSFPYADHLGLRLVDIQDAWAHREIVICFKSWDGLNRPTQELVSYLTKC